MAQLTLTLEQERQASSQLSQQAEQEHLTLHRRLQELQVQLETERAKTLEMSTALGRERELRMGVCSDGSPSNGEDRGGLEEEGSLLERLQRELDDKHVQVGCLWSFCTLRNLLQMATRGRTKSIIVKMSFVSIYQNHMLKLKINQKLYSEPSGPLPER